MKAFSKYTSFAGLVPAEPEHVVNHLEIKVRERKLGERLTDIVQPEIVTRNRDFFSTLAIVGIHPAGYKLEGAFFPHQRRFQLLGEAIVLFGSKGFIRGFQVPEIGAHCLHTSVLKDSMCVQKDVLVGRGSHMITRAREKLDGYETVVFGVDYGNIIDFFLWDNERIIRVNATEPCHMEKVGDKYFVLSDVKKDFSINVPWERHPWEQLSMDLIETCEEGLILDVDLEEYKVPKKLTFTVKINGDNLEDSAGEKRGVNLTANRSGMVDIDMEGKIVKARPDRVYPDSSQQIDVIKRCAATVEDLVSILPIQQYREMAEDSIKIYVGEQRDSVRYFNSKQAIWMNKYAREKKERMTKTEYIKGYIGHRVDRTGVGVFSYQEIKTHMHQNYMFPRDGKLFRLSYQPAQLYDRNGISNYPKRGYSIYVGIPEEIEMTLVCNFLYRGRIIIFFDPCMWKVARKWRLSDVRSRFKEYKSIEAYQDSRKWVSRNVKDEEEDDSV